MIICRNITTLEQTGNNFVYLFTMTKLVHITRMFSMLIFNKYTEKTNSVEYWPQIVA